MFVDLLEKRYFLRKLKKVKKSNGQMLAINEVWCVYLHFYVCVFHGWMDMIFNA